MRSSYSTLSTRGPAVFTLQSMLTLCSKHKYTVIFSVALIVLFRTFEPFFMVITLTSYTGCSSFRIPVASHLRVISLRSTSCLRSITLISSTVSNETSSSSLLLVKSSTKVSVTVTMNLPPSLLTA
ncbi:unnamed protein product [Haemonchus placei]|uniref:Secreted protein n=1 Tax=Haemonchus placei TaxID=6290 RepID=A0A0N4WTH4_HAEPC|nr:unnamed protein product [Haemonchus placei]